MWNAVADSSFLCIELVVNIKRNVFYNTQHVIPYTHYSDKRKCLVVQTISFIPNSTRLALKTSHVRRENKERGIKG
ncbi:hypothetical protein RJT34_10688 [Clitoria ternatea]|uniref:Uncharacterized protein n=1 Tax=Clitoria ternatea TaxID=43366 RepID=A0AAN9JII9_CLITE